MILLKRKPTRTIDVGRAECNAYVGSCVGASGAGACVCEQEKTCVSTAVSRCAAAGGRVLQFHGEAPTPRF